MIGNFPEAFYGGDEFFESKHETLFGLDPSAPGSLASNEFNSHDGMCQRFPFSLTPRSANSRPHMSSLFKPSWGRSVETLLLTLLLSLSLLFVGACTKKQATPGEEVLVFARPGDSVGFDLAAREEGESMNIAINILESLVQFDPETKAPVPQLAESWTISKDHLTYTFQLRKNVKFQDGTDLNADAVVFSIERQMSKDHPAYSTGAPYKYWDSMAMSEIVKSVKKIDEHTVQFQLKQPNAPFLANLTMGFMAIVSPAAVLKYGREFDKNPVGTGPYRLTEWKKDEFLELTAFDQYWGEAPKIKKVRVRVIPDNQVRLLELKKGNVHIMDYPNYSDLPSLKASGDVTLLQQEGMNLGYLALNMTKPPLDRVEVRQAIAMAIDRERIKQQIFQNYAVLAKNPYPPMLMGYNDQVPELKFDPEEAKKLLASTGLKNIQLELWAMPVARPYNPNARKMAEFIQADLKRVGIETKIVSHEWGIYLDKLGRGEHDMALIGWSGDNGDPDNFLFNLFSIEAAEAIPSQNYSFYKNKAFNNLIVRARTETDPKLRAELYGKAQEIIARDRPFVPLVHSLVVVPQRKEVTGYRIYPTGDRKFAQVEFVK